MTCIKLQRLHFLDLITIFFLSCPGMKRRLSFETLNWLHDLSNDIMNNVTINPMCDCMTDSMSDPTDNTMTDQNCDIRAVLQSCHVKCVCSKPLHDEMKSHTGCIWLINGIFSIHDLFWKNVTTQNKQPNSIVPGPSMAGRPSVEQPLWYFCTKINWWQ